MICTWKARWFTPKRWQTGLPHHTPLRSWWLTRFFFRLMQREYCRSATVVFSGSKEPEWGRKRGDLTDDGEIRRTADTNAEDGK